MDHHPLSPPRREEPQPPARPLGPEETVHTVIGSGGRRYACRDLPAVDAHLTELCARISTAETHFPALVHDYRADADQLLDLRIFLRASAELLG